MADDAQTLIEHAAAEGYHGLSDRGVLLGLLGSWAGSIALYAQDAVDGAAAQGYHALSDEMIEKALLYILQQ